MALRYSKLPKLPFPNNALECILLIVIPSASAIKSIISKPT